MARTTAPPAPIPSHRTGARLGSTARTPSGTTARRTSKSTRVSPPPTVTSAAAARGMETTPTVRRCVVIPDAGGRGGSGAWSVTWSRSRVRTATVMRWRRSTVVEGGGAAAPAATRSRTGTIGIVFPLRSRV